MVDDSAKLQAAYPGGNADHIRAQQALVVESWNALQERMARRKEELQASSDFQRFLTTVRDLVTWSSGLVAIMSSTEKVHDANEAQALRAEHDRLKGEIEAREDVFSSAVQAGETMILENHYALTEVRDRLKQLLQEREKLHAVWQRRKIYLDQLLDLQFFSRDAKQIESTCNTQEAALLGTDLGSTAEEVMAQFKKHEAFDKLVQAQDDRLALLIEHGDKLIGQNHFESQWIMKRVAEVTLRRNRVKELSNSRRNRLRDALLYAKFVRDVSEADVWIEERQKQLDVEAALGEVTSLEDKVSYFVEDHLKDVLNVSVVLGQEITKTPSVPGRSQRPSRPTERNQTNWRNTNFQEARSFARYPPAAGKSPASLEAAFGGLNSFGPRLGRSPRHSRLQHPTGESDGVDCRQGIDGPTGRSGPRLRALPGFATKAG